MNKIITVLICMLLTTTTITILFDDTKVEALPGESDGYEDESRFNFTYIKSLTENLSYTIFNAYNNTELRKG